MKKKPLIFKALGAFLACLLLCSSAGAYSPALHEMLHSHEKECPSEDKADFADFCSAQNHLAADIPGSDAPAFEILGNAQSLLKARHFQPFYSPQTTMSSRAPPSPSLCL